MVVKRSAVMLFLSVWVAPAAFAQSFSPATQYHVCFTPGQDCTAEIVDALSEARHSVYVQAYSFTSQPIAGALVAAKKRGVDVRVILDKSQFKAEKYSASTFLEHQDIPVWIDSRPAIAHNKIMILDGETVITGSFNFTKAAQEKNAENLLIIRDPGLAEQYANNWSMRQKESVAYSDYHPRSKKYPNTGV
jgi:phosphatidylserine/phosphatidylglycerophosphate/cardiolipin synthase-like enzyme